MLPRLLLLFASLLLLLAAPAREAVAAPRTEYKVDYTVQFQPKRKQALVTMRLTPGTGRVSEVRFAMPPKRYPDVRGEGQLKRTGDVVIWTPPAGKAASLTWAYVIDHQRRDGGYDARITEDWVIMRGDDLVPAARVRATVGADSQVRLRFVLPRGWTNVDTPYLLTRDRKAFVITNPERRFDRPVGWVIAGAVGTRREFLNGMEISVAGPKGDDVRRNDMLAFFNSLVPEFKLAFGILPAKLLIVSADDPMWRGGLSGPRSLFLHADRPMISENGTSTLVHELTHVITRIRGADKDDWIAEGLAEYYSIVLLHRAGLLSDARRDKAFEWMIRHGKPVTRLYTDRSSGQRTARAVVLFRDLDREIRSRSKGKASLDDITRALINVREVSREDLREQVSRRIGGESAVLASPLLD